MTHPSSPPAPMTAERLTRYRDEWCKDFWLHAQRERGLELFAHIDALTARVAELEGAIRKFPHFENDEPITVEAISKVAGEHVDMIMSWVPVQTKVAFVDDDGRQFEIVYEDGDSDAGIPSGWCVPEDADWQPARRGIEAELAAARKVDDAEVVEAVDWLLDRAECSSVTLDPSPMGPIAGLLTRLSAALKEAEAKLETIRRALFPDPEHHITHHARYNLEGALADLEAGQNDPTVRRTLKRVAGQIAAAERALQTKDTTE